MDDLSGDKVTAAAAPVVNGVSLVVIQELLGHADLRTTIRYLQVSNTAIRATRSPLETLGPLDLIQTR